MNIALDLGNIGSELSRAQAWEARGDNASRNQALIRALEILDKCIVSAAQLGQLKELTRLREIIADLLVLGKIFEVSIAQAKNYCLNFALVARRGT